MTSLGRQILDVGIECFGDPQAIQCQQGDQGAVAEVAEFGMYGLTEREFLVASRDQHRLVRNFEAVAAKSAGIPEPKTLFDAAGITRITANIYDERRSTSSLNSLGAS